MAVFFYCSMVQSPKWGIFQALTRKGVLFFNQFSDGMSIGANASISHTTKPRPMTTQTQTQATDQVLTDEQLEDLNGAGIGWVNTQVVCSASAGVSSTS